MSDYQEKVNETIRWLYRGGSGNGSIRTHPKIELHARGVDIEIEIGPDGKWLGTLSAPI